MTKGEVSKHAAEIAKREAAGEVVTTKRKQRSDNGIKSGKQAVNDKNGDSDGPSPSKRQKVLAKVAKKTPTTKKSSGRKKVLAMSQLPPSIEFIATDDDASCPLYAYKTHK